MTKSKKCVMESKDKYRYTPIEDVEDLKEMSEEIILTVSESINKSEEFFQNKQHQMEILEHAKELIKAITFKIDKLDSVYLDKKAL